MPIKGGGIDWIAVTTARMKGWQTISFKEKHFNHYRTLGTGDSNSVKATFNYGKKDWFLGGHPLWQIFRVLYRLKKRPYITGGAVLLAGYLWGMISNMERPVSKELMKFHRQEQMQKLKIILSTLLRLRKLDKFKLDA
jgi:hypothetical protein